MLLTQSLHFNPFAAFCADIRHFLAARPMMKSHSAVAFKRLLHWKNCICNDCAVPGGDIIGGMLDDKAAAVLIFAGGDGTGGAGVIADCRAVEQGGGEALAVWTALTAQNLDGVLHYWPVSADMIRRQFLALAAADIGAVKIGASGDDVAVVAECVDKLGGAKVVWDTVLAPTGGEPFAGRELQIQMIKHLLPRADVLTPNRKELAALAAVCKTMRGEISDKESAGGDDVLADESARRAAAGELLAAGGRKILLTDADDGGNFSLQLYAAPSDDSLCKENSADDFDSNSDLVWRMDYRRREGEYHGGGCFFSSFLAARLAAGDELQTAAAAALENTLAAIDNAASIPPLGRQKLLRPPRV